MKTIEYDIKKAAEQMNYDAMTDRELDALVAEKVMGWTAGMFQGYRAGSGDKVMHEAWLDGAEFVTWKNPWQPSKDIDQAFEVVEAMRERGYDYFILDQIDDGSWGAAFGETVPWKANPKLKEWKHYEVNKQPTAPRAICIAALNATEEVGT